MSVGRESGTIGSESEFKNGKHLVILVHGIRTYALWQNEIRQELERHGFLVELTNYGRFDLIRFLLPVPWFRRRAMARVWTDVQVAEQKHGKPSCVSFIAHSFGTYIVAKLLKAHFQFRAHRIIFCGSLVRYRFPFEQYLNRFNELLNEVGTRDYWPVLAESVTWGYGSTGTYGFRRPPLIDRWHNCVTHSAFLNAAFCKTFWVPFLQSGDLTLGSQNVESVPWWIAIWSVVRIKYLLLTVLLLLGGLFELRGSESTIDFRGTDVVFVGSKIKELNKEVEEQCTFWWPIEWLRGRRCVEVASFEQDVEKLIICPSKEITIKYRDAVEAFLELAREYTPCLGIEGLEEGRIKVSLDRVRAKPLIDGKGQTHWLCGCSSEDELRVRPLLGK
jgi:pimeloyl-ACP methyl ester carboxylesterase